MKRIAWIVCVALAVAAARAAAVDLSTEEQKTLYALGVAISNSLVDLTLTDAELEIVKAGLSDGVLKRPLKVDLQTYGPKLQQMSQARAGRIAENEKKAGAAYAAKAAAEPGAKKTASGVIVQTLKDGNGPTPSASDKVKVHYQGTLIDGTIFDSSIKRGAPATFSLSGVIRCWTEGLQQIKVGGKSRLVCPADVAYGERGAPPMIRPGATLVFEVELLEIVK